MALKIEKLYEELEEKNKLVMENDELSREILKLKGELVAVKFQQKASVIDECFSSCFVTIQFLVDQVNHEL